MRKALGGGVRSKTMCVLVLAAWPLQVATTDYFASTVLNSDASPSQPVQNTYGK